MSGEGGALAPLRHRYFRRLALGRFINMFGNAVAPIALAFAVLDLTGSVTDLGLVVGTRTLVTALLLLFGGVVADRFPRQFVLLGTGLVAALSQGAAAVLVLSDLATIPALIVLAAINGIAGSFSFPAVQALLPQTIPVEVQQQANALNRLGMHTAMIVGAPVGGLLVAGVGSGWGLAVDAATFAVAGLLFSGVRVPRARALTAPKRSTFADLREGWTEFASRPWVWVVVLAFCFLNAANSGSIQVLGPVIADDTIGRRAWGFVLAANTAGLVLGALIALRLRVRRFLLLGCVCMLGEIPLLLALGVSPVLPVLLLCAFGGGLAIEQFGIAWDVSLQRHIPSDRLARVYAYDAFGSLIAIPIGQVLIGPVALAIGAEATLFGAAAIIGLAVVGMVLSRDVRTLDNRVAAVPREATVLG